LSEITAVLVVQSVFIIIIIAVAVVKAYITIAIPTIRLRYDYDEKLTCSFFACIELEAGARDTS